MNAQNTNDKAQVCDFQEQMQATGQRFSVSIRDTNVAGHQGPKKAANQDIADETQGPRNFGNAEKAPEQRKEVMRTRGRKSSLRSKNHSIESQRSDGRKGKARQVVKPCMDHVRPNDMAELERMGEKLDAKLAVG